MSDRIRTIVADVLGVAATKLPPEASQSDVPEWTSLNHLRLITELESAFGVELTMDEALALTSLPRIRERLERDQHDAR
ncbi:MAG: acyl carrier protein [Gemmatimonadetes bacterium]|nr:acyl carrier protein [Gemmatimonadota bacterium]